MTREEAWEAMKKGKSVRHKFFFFDEHLYINKKGKVVNELGNCGEKFREKESNFWEDDWEIYGVN